MDVKEKLVELLGANTCKFDFCEDCEYCEDEDACIDYLKNSMADYLIAHSVTVQDGKDANVPTKTAERRMSMKKYHVATGDGNGYYGVGYESRIEAEERLKISQSHDPQAHIVEEEYHFTNADRIRAMSDEELAKKLILFNDIEGHVPFCKNLPECEELLETDPGIPLSKCKNCVLQWLKQPAEGE